MVRIMKGLNSNTFNFLNQPEQRSMLLIGKNYPHFIEAPEGAMPSRTLPESLDFFSTCVRYNRPCYLKTLALDWPATTKWAEKNGGQAYLKNKLGDQPVGAFLGEANNDKAEVRKWSFRSDFMQNITYGEFLDNQLAEPKITSLKSENKNVTDLLIDDIIVPDFYKDVAALDHVVLYQGAHFVDRPHYARQEQIMCAIDGVLSIMLIPHVNRQEVYTGQLNKDKQFSIY